MAEWTKAAVLKTAVGQPTGGSNPSPSAFKMRYNRGGAGVVERGRLLSACRGKTLPWVRIPPSPPEAEILSRDHALVAQWIEHLLAE
jgi:hypothetical protein